MIITEDEKVILPFTDLKDRKVISCKECFLILGKNFIEYKNVSEYEELDEDTGVFINKKSNYRWLRKRNSMSEVSMYFDIKYDIWAVELDFSGVSVRTGWSFEDPKEALAVYNKLSEYVKSDN